MSQLDDLNQAIADEDVELTTIAASITQIDADVEKLLANAPADLAAQIQKIKDHTAALLDGVSQLTAEDAKVNPPPPPPPAS